MSRKSKPAVIPRQPMSFIEVNTNLLLFHSICNHTTATLEERAALKHHQGGQIHKIMSYIFIMCGMLRTFVFHSCFFCNMTISLSGSQGIT